MKPLFTAVLLFAFTCASSQEQPIEKSANVLNTGSHKNQNGAKDKAAQILNAPTKEPTPAVSDVPPDSKQPIAHGHPYNEQEKQKNDDGWWAKLFADPIAFFTSLLFVATAGLWYATRRLVTGAEDTAKRQLRAYVTVPHVTIKNTKRQNGTTDQFAYIAVKNFGQTPASHCAYWLSISSNEFPLRTRLEKPDAAEDSGVGVIAPSDTLTIRTAIPSLSNDGEIYHGRYALYVHGEFRYTDVFGNRQTTWFRFMRNGEGWTSDGAMEICAEGNDAT